MNTIILCEGGTDAVLLQYFMRVANGWEYCNKNDSDLTIKKVDYGMKKINYFKKNEKILSIGATGGCSNIPKFFEKTIKNNKYSVKKIESLTKIIIVSDRDEIGTACDFKEKIKEILGKYSVNTIENIEENLWINCSCKNGKEDDLSFKILLMLVPFDEEGALETFLLNSVAKQDEYDKEIIDKGNRFVDEIDKEEKYLKKRRYKTKAKFDVYFSIRTSVGQFTERQNILKGVPWEEYQEVQDTFKRLSEI